MTHTKFLTEHTSNVTEPTLELVLVVICMFVCTCVSVTAREGQTQSSFLRTSCTLRQSLGVLELIDASHPQKST